MSDRDRTHEANELLRRLAREVFQDGIDIEQLPHAVDLVMRYEEAATQAERERAAKVAEGCAMLRSDVEVPRVLMAVADAIRRGE